MGAKISNVKNRTSKDYEFVFDGQVNIVPANSVVPLVHEVAVHGIRKSVISYNPITNTAIKALCFADSPEANEDIEPRKPGSELIDRSDMDEEDAKVELKTFKNNVGRATAISSALEGEE